MQRSSNLTSKNHGIIREVYFLTLSKPLSENLISLVERQLRVGSRGYSASELIAASNRNWPLV